MAIEKYKPYHNDSNFSKGEDLQGGQVLKIALV